MRWTDTLNTTEKNMVDRLDAEIAALRMQRYKIQNAASKRAMRGTNGKSAKSKTKHTAKAKKKRPSRKKPAAPQSPAE